MTIIAKQGVMSNGFSSVGILTPFSGTRSGLLAGRSLSLAFASSESPLHKYGLGWFSGWGKMDVGQRARLEPILQELKRLVLELDINK